MGTNNVFKRVFVSNENESSYFFAPIISSAITRVQLNAAGETNRLMLRSGSNKWTLMYSLPYTTCDRYGYCGANGICIENGDPICHCLKGFTPSSLEEWEVLNWSKGCIRKTPLDCNAGDGFVKLGGVKFPDLLQFWLNNSL